MPLLAPTGVAVRNSRCRTYADSFAETCVETGTNKTCRSSGCQHTTGTRVQQRTCVAVLYADVQLPHTESRRFVQWRLDGGHPRMATHSASW